MAEDQLKSPARILLIGGSAGSTNVLLKIVSQLNAAINLPIVLIVHRKATPDFLLGNLLSTRTSLPVKEVEEKENILPGTIYIAPADYHLLFEKDYTFSLDASEKINFSRPSIDVSFSSAAQAFGSKAAAILLSGANADGTDGLQSIRKHGGLTAVQDYISAESPFMPRNALEKMNDLTILQIEEMGKYIANLAEE